MFDFGFRPWGDVIGDVGNQVKEQINRYHQNRLQEQLLSRQDNLRNQDWAREDSIRNEGYRRQDEALGKPVNSDISGMMAELLGSTPKPNWEGLRPVQGDPAPSYNQRDINQLGQLAPFVKADKYNASKTRTPEDYALEYFKEEGRNTRNTNTLTTRKEEGSANRGVKRELSADQIALGYARIQAQIDEVEARIQAGASNEELKALNAIHVALINQQGNLFTKNTAIVGGPVNDANTAGNKEELKKVDELKTKYMRPPGTTGGVPATKDVKKTEVKGPVGSVWMMFPGATEPEEVTREEITLAKRKGGTIVAPPKKKK
jgi:hypothetical protein